jgi:hypothetical protein
MTLTALPNAAVSTFAYAQSSAIGPENTNRRRSHPKFGHERFHTRPQSSGFPYFIGAYEEDVIRIGESQ